MKCLLWKCPHARERCCDTLGECGAAHALAKAIEPSGYEVIERNNPTISALQKDGLVSLTGRNSTSIVSATPRGRARWYERDIP